MDNTQTVTHHYAGVLLVTNDGSMIGQQRDDKPEIDNPGKVATFGGTVETGEDHRQAAWRELVQEETNLVLPESSFQLFFEDIAWRPLTSEWEARHFFVATISDEELAKLEVYEGQGWAKIEDENDPRLVESWRPVIDAYLKK